MGAKIHHLMAEASQILFYLFFEIKAGVIGADANFHVDSYFAAGFGLS